MTKPIHKLVIVGRDLEAWLSALTLKMALAKTPHLSLTLVELPSMSEASESLVTLPVWQTLHNLLGIRDTQILKAGQGCFSLGQRYANWSRAAPAFVHAYDHNGSDIHGIPFFQYWIKARSLGMNVALEDFCLGSVAAKQGAALMHSENTQEISSARSGYHFSMREYVGAIAKATLNHDIKHITTTHLREVKISNGDITALVLANGELISGDLFIDASGEAALLMSALERARQQENNYRPLNAVFPCDKALIAEAKPLQPMPAFAQIAAMSCGWYGLYPLLKRTAVVAEFCSNEKSAQEVAEMVQVASGLMLNNITCIDLNIGYREQSWLANCISVGRAAARMDYLDALDTLPLQVCLAQLLEFFPLNTDCAFEAKIFNRTVANKLALARDFQLAHYTLNQRISEPFWERAAALSRPSSLQHKIDLFRSCGCVAIAEGEVFQTGSWEACLVGHGVIPESYNALVDNVPEEHLPEQFQALLKRIAAGVSEMPSMQTYVEMYS